MSLEHYRWKRHFDVTPESVGRSGLPTKAKKQLRYVIHKHHASHLHYDLRLEWNGVLSWAVPKGPSLDPSVKRLAVQVEDPPIEYGDFEGGIPPGDYGAGTVLIWDRGTWIPDDPDVDAALRRGRLKFTLHGRTLKGSWVHMRTRTRSIIASSRRPGWLLIKQRDAYASREEITVSRPHSVSSHRSLEELAGAPGSETKTTASGVRSSNTRRSKTPFPAPRSRRPVSATTRNR